MMGHLGFDAVLSDLSSLLCSGLQAHSVVPVPAPAQGLTCVGALQRVDANRHTAR